MVSDMVDTWEELCMGIIQQHDYLDRRLVAEKFKSQLREHQEETKQSGKSTLSKAGLQELEKKGKPQIEIVPCEGTPFLR